MSVLVMPVECLNYIHSGLVLAAYRSQADLYHAGNIHTYFHNRDIETEAVRLIESWATLNRYSYWVGYNDKVETLWSFGEYYEQRGQTYKINIYQLLKYVTCLEYNIELDTILSKNSYSNEPVADVPDLTNRQKEDYGLLVNWGHNIKSTIIGNILDYDLANWSDIPGTRPVIRDYMQRIIDENKTIQVKQLTAPL